ncbi:MAG: InlB B-repeat-containing protein, partial [Oscillospiraceae bacterium]|nr:InlB B-repeat-containing protein [Oscillospiraceae bacterium]
YTLRANTAPEFTRPGHSFAGWEIEGTTYAAGATITIGGDVTAVARWIPNQHTVRYEHGPSGLGGPYEVPVAFGTTHTLRPNTDPEFTRPGHSFAGWTIDGEDHAVGATITIGGDVTAVARWTPNQHTVRYEHGDGGSGGPYTVDVVFGEDYVLRFNTAPEFTRPGYNFVGWEIGGTELSAGDLITIDGDVTAVARWAWDSRTVTYKPGVGTGEPQTVAVATGATHSLLSNAATNFYHTGHIVVGWTIEDREYAVGEEITVTENVAAVARWGLAPTVTFRFRDNNQMDHEEIVQINFDEPIDPAVIADMMQRSGVNYGEAEQTYAFWGWFTDQVLEESGRVLPTTSTSINAGQRRPALVADGSPGFCARYGFTLSEEVFNDHRREQENTIVLYAVWSLWGDVDDNDMITFEDATLIQRHVALFPDIHIALPAADVRRTGVVDFADATLIQRYVALFPDTFLGRPVGWPPGNGRIGAFGLAPEDMRHLKPWEQSVLVG